MAVFRHEEIEFQEILFSESRQSLVPVQYYRDFINTIETDIEILDYGCGLGYVSNFYTNYFKSQDKVHIFACDYQEDLLDQIWKHIVKQKIEKLTPFFMPYQSHLSFPNWLPLIDHVILSLCLNQVDNPIEFFTTLKNILKDESLIHIVEWNKGFINQDLAYFIPENSRIEPDTMVAILESCGYALVKNVEKKEFSYTLTARLAS